MKAVQRVGGLSCVVLCAMPIVLGRGLLPEVVTSVVWLSVGECSFTRRKLMGQNPVLHVPEFTQAHPIEDTGFKV